MRFSLFIHMERYDESLTTQQHWENLVELTQMAEAGGFDTVWIGEHHSMEYTVSPNPLPQLAYLAAKTSTIRLGAGTIIAPFWNPIRAAGEVALLDVISNGRAELGVARGAYQFEFDRVAGGLPATDGGQHMQEIIPAIQKLWEGDYAHDGEVWQFPTSTSVPKPVQKKVPVWVAARSPESHDYAVANGCHVMVTPLMKGDEEVESLVEKFETAIANHPEITERPDIMVLRHTYVHSADEPEAWRPAAEGIQKFYRTFDAWFGNKTTPVNGFLEPSPLEKFEGRADFTVESLHKSAMIGTPAEVVERLRRYEALGVTEYSFWNDNSLSHEEKKRSLQLFIDEVVPQFAQAPSVLAMEK
ncbi:LLM class flavin-dependent oxidoreductase [Paeniglutamicibacter psychrophenolicus]|uniref:Alkanesulfonate monooxygenase SsuD/methylene tetrahydromethanopterin reductase-like flavin-dependent oxidoreductase (Luciferase family) n=1 Tax=Paeniglutamicibacter psychrophenolicus TaxID=257454 RepID=A0ABS4WAL0_9MICC|nr:LLM class flavin-dependent oxidoreductase [Paeniglutamicibacter psychrophenolicus]MBP2373244.1 alkanesulfonate monooxygenase SsuD/methylene tetrahydromethanopterin reductase-like flavin-dependent oxidoreductase (luciferase family) [Paeniglutamicibacter psychrophenolicus]